MTWILAQFDALFALLNAHPALYTFVVWPALGAAVSLYHSKIEPRFPRLSEFVRATGIDLPKAWSALQRRVPSAPPLPSDLPKVDPRLTMVLDEVLAEAEKTDNPTVVRWARMIEAARKPAESASPPPPPPVLPTAALVLLVLGAALLVPHVALADVVASEGGGREPSIALALIFGAIGLALGCVAGTLFARAANLRVLTCASHGFVVGDEVRFIAGCGVKRWIDRVGAELRLRWFVLVAVLCLALTSCCTSDRCRAVVTANVLHDAGEAAAFVIQRQCTEKYREADSLPQIAQLDKACLPASQAYGDFRKAHARLVAMLAALVAGDPGAAVHEALIAAQEAATELADALGGVPR